MALQTVLSLASAGAETLAIVGLVTYIRAASAGDASIDVNAGLVDASFSVVAFGAITLGLVLTMAVAQILAIWVRVRVGERWGWRTERRMVRAFIDASWETQSSTTVGEVQTLVLNMVSSSVGLLASTSRLLSSGISALILMAAAAVVSPLVALGLATAGAAVSMALRPLTNRGRRASKRAARAQVFVSERIDELRKLTREARILGVEDPLIDRFKDASRERFAANREARIISAMNPVLYRVFGLTLAVGAVLLSVTQPAVDLAQVGVIGLLLLRVVAYGQQLQAAGQQRAQQRPWLDDLQSWFVRLHDSTYLSGRSLGTSSEVAAIPVSREQAAIEVSSVSYGYGDGALAVKNATVTIASGEVVGLVGPSGSGKSTLAHLALGLLEPTVGRVTIAKIEARDLLAARDHSLAFVAQDPVVLNGSIADNIRFFRADVTLAQLEDAVDAAGLRDDIDMLPDGLDTVVGEHKRQLSGGQKQRLGIARALVGDPLVLVLDEPTSALDATSERQIRQTLKTLAGHTTVLLIAHRFTSLTECDRLIVMDQGTIAATGTPSQLIHENDFVRFAWSQAGEVTAMSEPRPKPHAPHRHATPSS